MCKEIDNFDGQPLYYCLYYCSFGIFTIGGLVTNDYCIIKCKKNPEDCIFRQTADKYVERRIEKDETR